MKLTFLVFVLVLFVATVKCKPAAKAEPSIIAGYGYGYGYPGLYGGWGGYGGYGGYGIGFYSGYRPYGGWRGNWGYGYPYY